MDANESTADCKYHNRKPLSKFAKTYKLETFEKKLLIIFHHYKVCGYDEPRKGNDKDVEALKRTFGNIGFEIVEKPDLTKHQILSALDKCLDRDFTDYGCVAVVVLTHGSMYGELKASMAPSYNENDIIERLRVNNNPSLHTKPRLVILQACRGKLDVASTSVDVGKQAEVAQNMSEEHFYSLSIEDDMLIMHGTYPGKAAARSIQGSWFIQTLCEKIDKLSNVMDLKSILIEMKRAVAHKEHSESNKEMCKQMPITTSTLTRELYLRDQKDQKEDELMKLNRSESSTIPESMPVCQDEFNRYIEYAKIALEFLKETETVELHRDWGDPQINLHEIQDYYEKLMTSLEIKQPHIRNVIKRLSVMTEALQNNSTEPKQYVKEVKNLTQMIQLKWENLLQLTLCLETHRKHTAQYRDFFSEITILENNIQQCEKALNTIIPSSLTLDHVDDLNKRLREIFRELQSHEKTLDRLSNDYQEIRSLKLRKVPVSRPLKAETVCCYNFGDQVVPTIGHGTEVTVIDNSNSTRWKVKLDADTEIELASVIITLPPPCQEAIDSFSRLKDVHGRVLQLWQKKFCRFRLNSIFVTIKVVKSWSSETILGIDAEERQQIHAALNEDVQKIRTECPPSDPQIRILLKEMEDVNILFDEVERTNHAASEDVSNYYTEQISNFFEKLANIEAELLKRVETKIYLDVDTLDYLIQEQRDVDSKLSVFLEELQRCKSAKRQEVEDKWKELHSKCLNFGESLTTLKDIFITKDEMKLFMSNAESQLMPTNEMRFDNMKIISDAIDIYKNLMNVISPKNYTTHIKLMKANIVKYKYSVNFAERDSLRNIYKELKQLSDRWIKLKTFTTVTVANYEAAYKQLVAYNMTWQAEYNRLSEISLSLERLVESSATKKEKIHETQNLHAMIEREGDMKYLMELRTEIVEESQIYSERYKTFTSFLIEIGVCSSSDIERSHKRAQKDLEVRLRAMDLSAEPGSNGPETSYFNKLDEINDYYKSLLKKIQNTLTLLKHSDN